MDIDYNKIFTGKQIENITFNELERLKKVANLERSYIFFNNKEITSQLLARKVNERVELTAKYSEETGLSKGILVSTILFPNDKKFAGMLVDAGYTLEYLQKLSVLVKYVKLSKKKNNSLANEDDVISICESRISKLISRVNYYFGINNAEAIINKVTELITLRPELFVKQKEDKKVR